ncbi:hypothetical protein [Niabella hirudinis]|uniref:hypothetical protein n=1 Tax=Niabella hirudinis TaxID=1285929 RepID=UPI003EBB7BAE
MGDIIFRAKKITETAKDVTWIAHEGDTQLSAKGFMRKSGEQGEQLLRGAPPKREQPVILPEVEKIELESVLDEGIGYKKGGDKRKGFVFNKNYYVKVVSFKNGEDPGDYNLIKWAYRYETEAGVFEGILNVRGRRVCFNFKNIPDLCGRGITIYAFIHNKNTGGKANFWIHYRFRWFGRDQVKNEVNERKVLPWKINQSATSLCGMACMAYLLAREDPDGYEQLALKLHQQGKVVYKNYTIEPDKDLFEMNPADPKCKYPHHTMPYIDWILLASLRSSESSIGYKGQAGEDFKAINWPTIMVSLGKKLLGYKTVEIDFYKANKSYIRDYFGSDEKLRILEKDIDRDYKNGYRICMMIDGDMMYGKSEYTWSDFQDYHWIVYEGGLGLLNDTGVPETDYDDVKTVKFKEFTWGEDVQNSRTMKGISKKAFISNYYAYIKLK